MSDTEAGNENIELVLQQGAVELLHIAHFYKRRAVVNKAVEVEQVVRNVRREKRSEKDQAA